MLEILFWILSALAVIGGVAAISLRTPLYCALSLIVSFVSLAGLYFQLKAAFPGILQIMLYAGAIMVLVVFVIMFINLPEDEIDADERSRAGVLISLLFLVPLAALLIGVVWTSEMEPFEAVAADFGSIPVVGRELFTTWLYPFEVLSLLIVAAMVGAVVIAKKRLTDE